MHPRRATASDACSLTDLHLDVWDEAYADLLPPHLLISRRGDRAARIERLQRVLARNGMDGSTVWIVDDPAQPDRLLGFATGGGRRDEDPALPEAELWACYVRAEAYGTGLGHALLVAAVGTGPAYLWVLEGNARATRFYEKHGFALDGATKEGFERHELRMVRR